MRLLPDFHAADAPAADGSAPAAAPGRRLAAVGARPDAPGCRSARSARATASASSPTCCALDERSRYLRFGYAASDAQIQPLRRHARLRARRGVRHLQPPPRADRARPSGAPRRRCRRAAAPAMSEFGVSVLPKARRRGFGRRLFEHAMLHARNRGVETMFIHALSENTAMLKIARKRRRDDRARRLRVRGLAEAAARFVRLAPRTRSSGERAAEFDYRLKLHAHRPDDLLDAAAGRQDARAPSRRRARAGVP